MLAGDSVDIESRKDVTCTLGTDARVKLYDVTGAQFLDVGRSLGGTQLKGWDRLRLATDGAENTVQVGDVVFTTDSEGNGGEKVTSIRSALGGKLRIGGDVSFERSTLTKTDSNIVDGDFFAQSLQLWKEVPPTRTNSQTGELEYSENDPNLVGFQLVITDTYKLELNKYTRFAGAGGTGCTHVTKLAGAFGTADLTPSLQSTADNSHFERTFGCESGVPARVQNPNNGLWHEGVLSDTIWSDDKVGIGVSDPQYRLHVVGDQESTSDKIVTNLPIETTSYMKAQAILTESDARVKCDVEAMDKASSMAIISKLRPCRYTQLTGERRRLDGFIAQEVRDTVPSAVSVKPSQDHGISDFHYLEAMPLISHLVNVVQNLTDRIRVLETR